MSRHRALALLIEADHRASDVEAIHLGDRPGDLVLYRTDLRDVLEHVLRRHLEHRTALRVHQERLERLIPFGIVLRDRNGQHQVDDALIRREGHQDFTPFRETERFRSGAFTTFPVTLRGKDTEIEHDVGGHLVGGELCAG
ncbi:hypothetical protein AB5I41_14485 [Sphingomonas sp. MMS24-JH45]